MIDPDRIHPGLREPALEWRRRCGDWASWFTDFDETVRRLGQEEAERIGGEVRDAMDRAAEGLIRAAFQLGRAEG